MDQPGLQQKVPRDFMVSTAIWTQRGRFTDIQQKQLYQWIGCGALTLVYGLCSGDGKVTQADESAMSLRDGMCDGQGSIFPPGER